MADIYLLRHGQTTYNAAGILQGHIDSFLSEQGRLQCQAAGKALSSVPFDAVFTSDLSRCVETAELILGETNKGPDGVAIQTSTDWRERSMGELEGMPLADARALALASGKTMQEFGESKTARTQKNMKALAYTLEQIRQKKSTKVLIVSHGSVIPRVLHACLKEGIITMAAGLGESDIKVPANTAISRLRLEKDTIMLLDVNNVDHLSKKVSKKVDPNLL